MITNSVIIGRVQDYLDVIKSDYSQRYDPTEFEIYLDNTGIKYNRIVKISYGQRSVHAFVDNDGLLYMAAGWKAPAKQARYDLLNSDSFNALLAHTTWSGGHLYLAKDRGQLPKGYTVADRPVVEAVPEQWTVVPAPETLPEWPSPRGTGLKGLNTARVVVRPPRKSRKSA